MIYNIKPSAAAAPMTLLDECNWNAAILRTARDVLCSVGWGRYGNGNRIFFERKTRFVRFRQCGFFFFATNGKFHPSVFWDNFFPRIFYFLSVYYLLICFVFDFRFIVISLLLLLLLFSYVERFRKPTDGSRHRRHRSRVSRPTSWVLYNTRA